MIDEYSRYPKVHRDTSMCQDEQQGSDPSSEQGLLHSRHTAEVIQTDGGPPLRVCVQTVCGVAGGNTPSGVTRDVLTYKARDVQSAEAVYKSQSPLIYTVRSCRSPLH